MQKSILNPLLPQPILEEGVLSRKHTDGSPIQEPYRMKILSADCLDDIMALQDLTVKRLSRPDMLQPFSASFMERHFEKQGRILGVFVDNNLIAFRNIYFPAPDDGEWNLGIDIGLAPEKTDKVANLQMVCVHPEYRGNSLGLKMNRHALALLKSMGNFPHVCATVSPYNYWNVRILMKSGFIIKKLKKKYTGKMRFIVYQNIAATSPAPNGAIINCNLFDLEKQRALLKEGYNGIRFNALKPHNPIREFWREKALTQGAPHYEITYAQPR